MKNIKKTTTSQVDYYATGWLFTKLTLFQIKL